MYKHKPHWLIDELQQNCHPCLVAVQEKSYLCVLPVWGQVEGIQAGDMRLNVILLPTIYMCHFSALGKQQRLFSFWLFHLVLQIGGLPGFVVNFPKTDLPQLGCVLVVLAFTWSLKSVAGLSCHDFTQLLLVLADPACLLWVSPYSSVGFLLCYTPHLKTTFYTFVTGRFHEDVSTASLCICVYRSWRSPSGNLYLWAQDCSPVGWKEYVPLVQLAAGLILGALKMDCVLLKLWLKSITLTFTHLKCKESFVFFLHHHFGLVFVFQQGLNCSHLVKLFHLLGHWYLLFILLIMFLLFDFYFNHSLGSFPDDYILHYYWKNVQVSLQNRHTPLWWRESE